MKKILIYIFLVAAFSINAQTVLGDFGGYLKVATNPVVSGVNYTMMVSGFVGTPKFGGNTCQFSDMKIDSVNTKDVFYNSSISRFVLISRVGNTITFKDVDAAQSSVLPVKGDILMVSRETQINGFYVGSIPQNGDGSGGAISGITTEMAAGVQLHYDKIKQMISKLSINTDSLVNVHYEQTVIGKKTLTDTLKVSKGIVSSGTIKSNGGVGYATVEFNGVVAENDTTVTTNFTLNGTYGSVGVDCTNGTRSVQLPNTATSKNWKYYISKEDETLNPLQVTDANGVVIYTILNKLVIQIKNKNNSWKRLN